MKLSTHAVADTYNSLDMNFGNVIKPINRSNKSLGITGMKNILKKYLVIVLTYNASVEKPRKAALFQHL